MEDRVSSLKKELLNAADEKYRDFSRGLIPGEDSLIGVRIPDIRNLAKKACEDDGVFYIKNFGKCGYFEEKMLLAFIIAEVNCPIEEKISYIKDFLPLIDNWSLCDSFCSDLKIVKSHRDVFKELIDECAKSKKTYYKRFAVVLALNYYVDSIYLKWLFRLFTSVSHENEDYYVKMAVAWAVSICFIKYPEETYRFLSDCQLDDDTYNKSLQKISESKRVSISSKNIIRAMKR